MRTLQNLMVYFLSASLLFISTGCTAREKDNEVNSTGTHKTSEDMTEKITILDTVLNTLNNETDTNLLTNKFKKIVFVEEALENIEDYEGSYKNSDGKVQSTVYGIEGTYTVNEKTDMHVSLIFDNTLNNGGYVASISNSSADTSIFKYKYFYIIFNVIGAGTDKSEMEEVFNLKMRFYNTLKNMKL